MGDGVTRIGGIIAAVVMVTSFAANSAANADPAVPATVFAPVPTPALADPQRFALPYATPKFDLGGLESGKFRKDAPPLSFDTVDLGTSSLRFDLIDNTMTRPDAPDLTDVIVPLRPGKKRSTPRYFGLTLVTPTH